MINFLFRKQTLDYRPNKNDFLLNCLIISKTDIIKDCENHVDCYLLIEKILPDGLVINDPMSGLFPEFISYKQFENDYVIVPKRS